MMSYSTGHPPPAPASASASASLQSQGQSPSSSATILVRHLPEAIPQDTLFRLFSHYGACAVRPGTAGRLRNCAFVDFQTEALAAQAHSQLNRLRFLGKVLKVERANNPSRNDIHNRQEEALHVKDSNSLPASLMKDPSSAANLSKGVNSAGEPIAPRLGVDYPFPPHLGYAYPPPDGNILTNIVNALIAVPRFYTQVLHLMNKMNIPAPFRMALPTPPLPTSAPAPPPPPPTVVAKSPLSDLSSDESELESSEGEDDKEKSSFVGASKKMKHGRKRPRQEAIVGPAIDKDVAHEAVGLKPASLIPKEIPMIKKKNPVLQIKFAAKQKKSENKDVANDTEESADPDKEDLELKPFATTKDLEDGKLPPEEILSLPMFKNYTAGNPATVLYIKNLAKDVVIDDFYFIFGSLFGEGEAAKSGLSIKLMQEGRMKGQAFVTFPSVDLAHSALNLVNGYVFKGKPMIIQFGRNPAAAGRGN